LHGFCRYDLLKKELEEIVIKRVAFGGGILFLVFFLLMLRGEAAAFGKMSEGYLVVFSGRSLQASTSEGNPLDREPQCYITEAGYVAAMEEDLLDEAIYWAGMGSEQDFVRFLDSTPRVFPLKGGMRVHLEGYSFCGKVKIRPQGSRISVWTIREAIRTEIRF